MKLSIALCVAVIMFLSISGFSQDGNEKDVSVKADFLATDQTAVKLPLPEYPDKAKKIGLGGALSVQIAVDENGNVTLLREANGPYPVCISVTTPPVLALRQAATNAAKKAKFSPGGRPNVQSSALLTYNLTPPADGKFSGEDLSAQTVEPNSAPTYSGNVRLVTGNSSSVSSLQPGTKLPKTVSGGVLNGKALALPAPPYPPAAKAVRAFGAVSVQVLILEDGTVYSASAVSGHPLLRRSSEIAACSSRSSPTQLQSQPVKVSGIITYNYSL